MATKNLATVPSTELSDSVNFITENGGELVRLPYTVIKNKIDTINTEIANLNNLIGGNTAGIEKIQSQFIYANSKAEIISAMEKLDLERTYTCFLSAACVTELTTNYSVAAKGYVSKPAATMIDLCIQIGSDDVLFGRLNTSTGLFTFNETCTISELNALATTVSNIQSTVSGHTTNIQTNATNIANNALAITKLNSELETCDLLLDLEGVTTVDAVGIGYGLAKPMSDYSKIGIALTLNENDRICSFMVIPRTIFESGKLFEFKDPFDPGNFIFIRMSDDSSVQVRRYSTKISVEIYGVH